MKRWCLLVQIHQWPFPCLTFALAWQLSFTVLLTTDKLVFFLFLLLFSLCRFANFQDGKLFMSFAQCPRRRLSLEKKVWHNLWLKELVTLLSRHFKGSTSIRHAVTSSRSFLGHLPSDTFFVEFCFEFYLIHFVGVETFSQRNPNVKVFHRW